MILANPVTGQFLRWRDVLKRMAARQAHHAVPRRQIAEIFGSRPAPGRAAKRVAGAAGWSDDHFKILFSALLRSKQADWSIADDAPRDFLSALRTSLWDYRM